LSAETDAGKVLRCELTIVNSRGLHARASAKFVKCADSYDAQLTVSRDGQSAPGTSIMGLMMLAAGIGSEIELSCSGRQAAEAMAALSALVESKFGED
jgi:phosphocarrier protein